MPFISLPLSNHYFISVYQIYILLTRSWGTKFTSCFKMIRNNLIGYNCFGWDICSISLTFKCVLVYFLSFWHQPFPFHILKIVPLACPLSVLVGRNLACTVWEILGLKFFTIWGTAKWFSRKGPCPRNRYGDF